MLKAFIIALIAISGTRQACAAGCLKCNTAGDCLVADITTNYYLNGTTATKVTLDNCQQITHDGKCGLCNQNYYVDAATGKCVAVPTASLISNCSTYSNATSCTTCATDYYLSANACVAVETKIANCMTYSGAAVCSQCAKDYLLSLDAKSCVAAPTTSNCGDYTFVRCNTCESGFVLNPNNYLHASLVATSAEDRVRLASLAFGLKDNYKGLTSQAACQVQSTTNCATFDQGTNTCTACVNDYYLDDKAMCVKEPNEPIENCLHYTNATTCKECNAGYYLKSSVCTQITGTALIANCATYNGSGTSVQCLACSANYYLNNSTCVLRVNSADTKIANCATKNGSADNCAACASGYYLTNDKLECLANIANCASYPTTSSGQTLTCTKCDDGFYLKTTSTGTGTTYECLAGNVQNCKEYNNNDANACTLCNNKFLLENNACVAHVEITGCSVYSSSDKNTCNTCTHTANYNFDIEKSCQAIPTASLITNCATYSGDLTNIQCATCANGYYLLNNACVQLTIDQCISQTGDLCDSCKQTYALSYDKKKCISVFGYMADQCEQNQTVSTSNAMYANAVTCNHCKEHAIPYNHNNHFVCMSTTEIKDVKETASDSVIITGCSKYNEDIECVQCDVSSATPFLDTATSPPSCKAACDTAYYYKVKLDANNQLSQFNVCYNAATDAGLTIVTAANCAVYAPNLNNTGAVEYICIKCKSNFITILDATETEYSNVDPDATSLSLFFPSIHARYPAVSCHVIDGTTKIVGVTTQTLISNCAYYREDISDDFSCLKCDQGYTGTINDANRISACTRDSNCTTDRLYKLDYFAANLASCHKCTSSTSIPFIHYVSALDDLDSDGADDDLTYAFNGFAEYATTISGADFADAAGTQKNVVCRVNAAATFGITGNYGVADNCGIGALVVNSNGIGNNTDAFGTFCAACKPGYKATNDGTNAFIKTACTAITNCANNGTFFNGCSDCNTGYIHKFAAGNIAYDECLAVPSSLTTKLANCHAATANATTVTNADACSVCKRGYILNADGYCESYRPYQCESGYFRLSASTTRTHWNWALYLQGTGVGCDRCANTYYAVKITVDRDVCLSSSWVNTSVDALTVDTSEFIPRCKNYHADSDTLKCKTCDTSYVVSGTAANTLTETQCFANTSIANCAVASSATVCLKCISADYGLKSNKCEAGTITNCAAYNYDSNDTIVRCTQCSPNFYLNTTTNKCEAAQIYNCKRLTDDSPKKCSECADGYVRLADLKNSYDYCYKKDSSLGCSEMTYVSGGLGGSLTCTACTNNSTQLPGVVAAASAQTVCVNFDLIGNCKSYDIDSTLNTSNFTCTACNDGFYLKDNACIARVNKPSKCITYSSSDDICNACDNTSYLDDNAKVCTDYPKGILGCETYSNATTCISCKPGRYLSSNTCPSVTTPIESCSYYSANNVCSSCLSTHALLNNTCVKATATNCASYASATACATCIAGNVLETTNGVTNCVARSKTGCALLDINSPYNCLRCEGTYYLDAGECKSPTTIANCAAYDSQTTCSLCNKGFALSADKTACTNSGLAVAYIDTQCSDTQVASTPVCARCDAGYYFVNGACTGSCNSSTVSGCLACNPDTPTVCFICSTGYYQDKDGKCNAIAVPDSNAMIMGVMTMLVALISLMF